VLREVAGVRLVTPLDRAGISLRIPHDDLQEGRLPDPVRTHDHQPIAALHAEIDPVEDLLLAVGLPDSLDLQNLLPARSSLREAELRIAARAARELLEVLRHTLDHPQLALRLPGLAR